ncbi:MAG TPA: IS110 family transposase [Streptosporangiaceae bacterium]
MSQGNNGLSRGDRNRNARLAALRAAVPRDHGVLGIDLAQSRQAAVLADHDSRVIARWRPRCSPWKLGELLERALRKALAAGFSGVTVACEPTGHRWMVIAQLAAERNIAMVCVQPLVVARAREAEDYTRGKSDDRDAVLIARLAGQLHCYLPEQADQGWARLRHLGARRARLTEDSTACRQQLRDLLEVAWPAVLATAADPLESATWLACVQVALARCDGDLAAVHALGQDAFTAAARAALGAFGAKRICQRIAAAVYAALAGPAGVAAQRHGALERGFQVLGDWQATRGELAEVNARMLGCLEAMGLAGVAGSIPGVSALQVAAILADSGDPSRFRTSRAMVKHAGLAPCENSSGNHAGEACISRRGRPALRLAAWRAVWAALRHNPVYAARHAELTGRANDPLTDQQARAAIAAALIRQIHAIITRRVPWDADIAAGRRRPGQEVTAAA